MSEIATVRPQAGTPLANALVPSTVEAAMRLAEIMSSANLVPAHLQGKVGDCYLVISQAQRWGMDPVAVAQSTAVVHGKLCYEGKLVSAVLKTSGVSGGRQLQYSFTGDGRHVLGDLRFHREAKGFEIKAHALLQFGAFVILETRIRRGLIIGRPE